jgi:peptidoglycan/LPS O-acetylase OafA/YrhL
MRIKELDGLRGVAVLAVIDWHYFSWLPVAGSAYGWLGVDLFFVLSGFLITSILLELREETHYFRIFYLRRALRIFPPYFLGLGIYFAVSIALGQPGTLKMWLGFVFYYSSLIYPPRLVHESLLRMVPAVSLGLAVLWSLSVEEIYYTIWAPIVRFTNMTAFAIVLVAMIVAAPLLRWWLYTPDYFQVLSFYARMDGLAYGSAVALLVHHRRHAPQSWIVADRIFNWAAILVSTISIVYWLRFGGAPINPGVSLGITFADMSFALITYALIRCSGSNRPWVGVFRMRWLRSIGVVSYSLYLFHMPLLIVSQRLIVPFHLIHRRYAAAASFVGLVLSLAVAYGLWYGMESRILRWKDRKVPSAAHP